MYHQDGHFRRRVDIDVFYAVRDHDHLAKRIYAALYSPMVMFTVWLRTLSMAGHVTAFISNPPGLNTETARTFAERDSSKPVVKTQSAWNMRESEREWRAEELGETFYTLGND
jgi:hypothetical protein